MEKMKTDVYEKYELPKLLKLTKVLKPVPRADEMCIQINAIGITASDVFNRNSHNPLRKKLPMRFAFGVFKSKKRTMGLVFSGVIDSVGQGVKRFKVGDEVYGIPDYNFGTYAKYLCFKETDSQMGCIAVKPTNLTHEEAAVIAFSGLLALQQIENANLQKGQKVLIYETFGTSGALAIQMAKHIGAEVTGVCSSSNIEMMNEIGVDKVIDYTKQHTLPHGETYDLILDTEEKFKKSKLKRACKKALKPNGRYLCIDDSALLLDSKRLDKITKLIEIGHLKPVMDKIYPLEEIVYSCRCIETEHKKAR
jgi:NADPH:quinone reductase-like Zn-dependent oxidoreductase